MSEFPAANQQEAQDHGRSETYDRMDPDPDFPEASGSLEAELEVLEQRLHEVTDLVRRLREENDALRGDCAALSREREEVERDRAGLQRERDSLLRERGAVSSRLAQIIAKVDALRGET